MKEPLPIVKLVAMPIFLGRAGGGLPYKSDRANAALF